MLYEMKLDDIIKQSEEYKTVLLELAEGKKDKHRSLYQELIDGIDRVVVVAANYYNNGCTDKDYWDVKDAVWDLRLDTKARRAEGFISPVFADELMAYYWSLIC